MVSKIHLNLRNRTKGNTVHLRSSILLRTEKLKPRRGVITEPTALRGPQCAPVLRVMGW
jgi:hypothetical protein